jgi:hypothetical protein
MHSTVSRIGYAVVDIKINLHSVVMVSEANASNGERELVSLCSGVDIWVLEMDLVVVERYQKNEHTYNMPHIVRELNMLSEYVRDTYLGAGYGFMLI